MFTQFLARFIFVVTAGLLSSCGSPAPTTSVKADLADAQTTLAGTKRVCRDGPEGGPYVPPPLNEADRVKAEWDIAAAKNLDNVSTEQEWEIRASLGAEMGLAPSQVNGWRQIYKARAESAQKKLAASKQPSEAEVVAYKAKVKQDACAALPDAAKRVAALASKLGRMEQAARRQSILLKLTAAAVVGFVGLVIWIFRRAERRKRSELDRKVRQIALDGQLRIAEIYRDRFSASLWEEVVNAHASGDQARLESLVEHAQGLPSPYARDLFPPRPPRRPLGR